MKGRIGDEIGRDLGDREKSTVVVGRQMVQDGRARILEDARDAGLDASWRGRGMSAACNTVGASYSLRCFAWPQRPTPVDFDRAASTTRFGSAIGKTDGAEHQRQMEAPPPDVPCVAARLRNERLRRPSPVRSEVQHATHGGTTGKFHRLRRIHTTAADPHRASVGRADLPQHFDT